MPGVSLPLQRRGFAETARKDNWWVPPLLVFAGFSLSVAVLFLGLLAYDAIKAFFFADGIGIGVGSLVLTANVILLGGYTFGCHSMRHLVGGRKDCLSTSPTCHSLYNGCSALNR